VRFAILLAALLSALAAAWYLAARGETSHPEQVSSLAGVEGGASDGSREDRDASTKITTTSGLQTTVPDTLGYDEQTAIFTLEQGGFRVRVMNWMVSDSRKEGVVVQQLPRGGLTRRVNWTVTIVVGRLR
jgi:PASTA domain-containing protein